MSDTRCAPRRDVAAATSPAAPRRFGLHGDVDVGFVDEAYARARLLSEIVLANGGHHPYGLAVSKQ